MFANKYIIRDNMCLPIPGINGAQEHVSRFFLHTKAAEIELTQEKNEQENKKIPTAMSALSKRFYIFATS